MRAMLVLTNGAVYTQDARRPKVSAVAVRDGKVLAVGSDSEMKALLADGGDWVDLGGRCLIPGLVDAHVHFEGFSLSLQRVNLAGTANLDEALARVAARVDEAEAGVWLEGRGWNQTDWPGGAFPTAADLDKIVSHRPVLMRHKSGHAAWANSLALKMAGVTAETADPPGGQIQRDGQGRPTGVLFEDAMSFVSDLIPRATEAQVVAAMRQGQEYCLRAGLTGLHDFDGRRCFRSLQTLHQNEELKLRIVKNIRVRYLDEAVGVGLKTGFGDDHLWIGGVKIFADGALGPRTAAMLAPYEGEPENRGIVVTDKEEMFAYASKASANGLSVTVHAIGDRANHDILDVYEAVRGEEAARMDGAALRHRIEHVQILHSADFERLAALNVIASMQPIHATSDMEMADRYWGERNKYSYAWRTVKETGAVLAFGSDAPVDPIEPLGGVYAAVSRRRPDGTPGVDGWYPEQRLTMAEAVEGFTMGAAFAGNRERLSGSIEVGKWADFTILDRDIFTIPHDEFLDVSVEGTVIGGEFKFRTF
ncbi:MAG: amidohydrolase [Candidatus Promineifilaceae bacterium]